MFGISRINKFLERFISAARIDQKCSLSAIVSGQILYHQRLAVSQSSSLVNTIPGHIDLYINKSIFLCMLEKLISMAMLHGRDTVLSIHAQSLNDILIVYITSSNTYNSYAVHSQFDEVQCFVRKFGAGLHIDSIRNKETRITLLMLNKAMRA